MNSTAVAENANRMSKEELLELKEAMNQKALTKKKNQNSNNNCCKYNGSIGCAASAALCGQHCFYAIGRVIYNRLEFASKKSNTSKF